jgi:hypothetical protein
VSATELSKAAKAMAESAEPVSLPDGLARLRDPFPASQVGVLPKPYKKDAQKGNCAECGKWHGLPAMHLDFVGHGAVTARLLDVDPHWTWEPFALDPVGLPALDRHGNLWIRLTVCGVTRIGVGDGASMKVLIGDAIRNAAMRFGVALDLWVRGSEDEKAEDGEQMADPPPVWNTAAAKAHLVTLAEGDTSLAKQAWEEIDGEGKTRDELTAAFEAWVNQPAPDPVPEQEGDPT